jgi:hypothetical protein
MLRFKFRSLVCIEILSPADVYDSDHQVSCSLLCLFLNLVHFWNLDLPACFIIPALYLLLLVRTMSY